ncbi:MAG: hypothetical protein IPM38_15630 [Ignavibacteria bacterium]|nr:hypothetical protein [Ignavibacteria bacterium]
MQKSTALEIIKTFTPGDIERFEDFLKSPFFNKNSNVIRLFNLLKKYSPDYVSSALDKQMMWRELFPDKAYNYGSMKNLIFELKKLAAKYITIDELGRNKLEEDEILVRALGKRNIPKFFINKVSEIEKKYRIENLQNLETELEDYFTYMFKIKWMKHAYLRFYNQRLAKDEDLIAYTALMTGSFIIYTSMYYNNVMAQSLDVNFTPEHNAVVSLVETLKSTSTAEILKAISKFSIAAGKITNLHWLKTKVVMKDASEEDFFQLRDEVYRNTDMLPVLSLKGFLTSIVNSAAMLDSPDINISKERIDALKLRMKKKMIAHDDGRVYLPELLQYFWSASNLNDYEVIEKLIKEHVSKSNNEKKDNVMNCGEIFFCIRDKKFNEALELISTVTPESFMMKVHLRMLKTRCLYMINDYETFLYERDSLNHFLKSSKSLSEKNIRQLKDYFEKVNRMFRLKRNFEGSEFKKLNEEIVSNVNYPVWMREELSVIKIVR